jgi:hypothetical protein
MNVGLDEKRGKVNLSSVDVLTRINGLPEAANTTAACL